MIKDAGDHRIRLPQGRGWALSLSTRYHATNSLHAACSGLIIPRGYSRHHHLRCSITRLCRSFTAELKLEAASLVPDQGYSVPEASRSLDVGETILRRWVQQRQFE